MKNLSLDELVEALKVLAYMDDVFVAEDETKREDKKKKCECKNSCLELEKYVEDLEDENYEYYSENKLLKEKISELEQENKELRVTLERTFDTLDGLLLVTNKYYKALKSIGGIYNGLDIDEEEEYERI